MADFQPWSPPPQNTPLQTLAQVIGFKQAQQNLQTGQYQQQTAQAEAQAAQQKMQERLNVQQMMKSGVDDRGQSILGPDGSPDASKVIPALGRIAPLTGQGIAQNIIKTKTDNVGLEAASTNLDASQRKLLMGPIQAAGLDPSRPSSDVNADIDNLVKAHPEMANAANYAKSLTPHLDTVQDPQHKVQIANQIASRIQEGAPVETQPQPGSMDVGGSIQPGVVAPAASGGGFTPSGAPIKKTLAPAQQIPYLGAAAAASGAGGAAGSGTAGMDVDRAKQVGDLQQQSAAAITLTKQADALKDALDSGTLAKKISEGGNWLGFSSVNEARSQLVQDLGKMKGLVADRAGSDSRANTILEGYPSDTTPNNTFHADMDYIRGTGRQNLARGQLLSQYQNPKDPNAIRGFAAADNMLTATADPLVHEYAALKPSERAGFYTRNFSTPQQAQAFKDRVTALQRHTSVVPGQ